MNRGLYIAGSSMLALRSKMDVVTNNMANVDTIGYKYDDMITRSFDEILLDRMNENSIGGGTNVGPLGLGSHIDETVTYFEQGSLELTEENTDFAIQGNGFMVVRTPQGNRYTRAGNMTLNPEGFLVNPDGHFLLNTNNEPIALTQNEFDVDEQGNVFVNRELISTINVVDFNDLNTLQKEGHNLFAGDNPQAAQGYVLKQGFIEGSNIQMASEMVNMLTTSRAFDFSQRMVKMIDESLARTVNEIAKF